MGDDRADAVITDPPYDVNVEGRTKAKLKILNDNLGHIGTVKLLRASLSLALAYCRDGGAFYVWAPHGPSFLAFAQVATEQGWWHQTIVWVKDSFVLGRSDYHGRHEAILAGRKVALVTEQTPAREVEVLGYGWKPGAARTWSSDRRQDTAWECSRPRRSTEHPTMKPVALIERAIRNSTAQGATIVDPFAGSGTAIIAAEAAGRRCLAMELDPGYVDVILARYALLTGHKPARLEDLAGRR
jgi:site-specific DNA-methyltransferase (adenine-specific)